MKTIKTPTKSLQEKLANNQDLEKIILKSLRAANQKALKSLEPSLYNALSWPNTIEHYLAYLKTFSKWIPHQSLSSVWNSKNYDMNQEVFDRLCHFYWLIDQKVLPNNTKIIDDEIHGTWFKEWVLNYAKNWGHFLNTPDSFNTNVLDTFLSYAPQYNIQDSMIYDNRGTIRPNTPSGWLTFNQFFARKLNPGLRPISSPQSNELITAPADCIFHTSQQINNDNSILPITLKKTHVCNHINTLLSQSNYANDFKNGTLVHYQLGPYDYHRFHTPVAGEVIEAYTVQEITSLNIALKEHQFYVENNHLNNGYEFNQARGILILDTAQSNHSNIGKVAIIPIGMSQISSVNMNVTPGIQLQKGEEFGYFLFGGSDIIMLFQKGSNLQLDTEHKRHNYGSIIATAEAI